MMGGTRGRARCAALGSVMAVLLAAGACYPGQIQGVDEPDVVLTVFDSSAAFGSFGTYAMPDTVIRVDGQGTNLLPSPELDQQILDAVATEFAALEYTRVTSEAPGPPDVVVLLTVSASDGSLWTSDRWWSNWGWFPGWTSWYPAWDVNWMLRYPWAKTYPGVRRSGTLLITMIDPDHDGSEPQSIPVIWASALDGLYLGSEASVVSRFQGLVRQAFHQSPYLQRARP
jgi:hypothetical protein